MSMGRRNRTVFVGLGAAVLLAIGAWVAGAQIKSPAQIAAETAAPDPSSITVPVERRVLSSEVIVRGTVRYGSPQPVVLATSTLKQNSAASGGTDIVTTRPRARRAGRRGQPRHVGLRPPRVRAARRPAFAPGHPARQPRQDVRQLEAALARMGFSPGQIDGRYDGATASAVARWYERDGWTPFGATDTQLDQLRAAQSSRSRRARRIPAGQDHRRADATPAEIAQARIDLQTARDALVTAAARPLFADPRRRARARQRAPRQRSRRCRHRPQARGVEQGAGRADRGAAQPGHGAAGHSRRPSGRRSRPPCGPPATTSPSRRRT